MKLNISPKLFQKTTLAPIMQQSIEVLFLPLIELNQLVDQQLQENPLLEVVEEKPFADQLNDIMAHQTQKSHVSELPENSQSEDDEMPDESSAMIEAPLEDYLNQQLRMEISDLDELKIGEFIIGNLDEGGYFKCSIEETAEALKISNIAQIEKVLRAVQNFEPMGVAARDIKECLSIQAHYLFNDEDGALAVRIINEHLEDLAHKRFTEIAKKLTTPVLRVRDIARLIASLEPNPARKFRPIEDNIYMKPDVIVTQNTDGDYDVQTARANFPQLRISAYYQGLLQQKSLSDEERQFIHEKIKGALFFIKSVEQRHNTILEIAKYIVKQQKDFLEEGQAALKPMVLREVAEAISRNESTISRAINNKYIDTPQGLIPFKNFFSQAVDRTNSNRGIQEEIKLLIQKEDKCSPLSDQDIQKYLEHKGVRVARRTINKYRKILHILPSHLRKN
jgi:RNA polymerase sigma-54 factor